MHPPPRWTAEEFEAERRASIEIFRRQRMEEALEPYMDAYEAARQAVETLLELSVDLKDLRRCALDVLCDPALYTALRYLAGPMISNDDLRTLSDVSTVSANVHRANPHFSEAMVETVLLGLDRNRFPWVSERRDPTPEEKNAAVVATSSLMAQRRVMTDRANEAKDAQEQAVAAALVSAGFRQVPPRTVNTFSQAPAPGEFCHESDVAGRKADLVVRLWDGRLMPIECKVSNSSTNSIKRLNNDAAVKARWWVEKLGSSQTVPAAVLGGVFKLRNLMAAQTNELTIFWAHDLAKLVHFLDAAKP